MATKTQLIGGLFQDANGVVLNAGYLIFELSQDEQVNGNTAVAAGIKIKINLASTGSISTSPAQYIWANNDLLPINSFYTVSGYTAAGQLAWGPNYQQVTSGTTFDVGTWVPNLMTNWAPSLQPLILKTNGTLNGSQAILNLKNGSNITVTDDGVGGVTIANTYTYTLPSQPYDIAIPIVGQPTASERIGFEVPRSLAFVANFSTSYATAKTASTGTIVFNIYKNATTLVGTVTFTASVTGVFASTGGSAQSFVAGDLLELVCPASVDATWADGRFTIVGSR